MPTLTNRLKNIAIVVPCFNEQDVINQTYLALSKVINRLISKHLISSNSQIIFVDDGSKDKTWTIIENISSTSSIVSGIKLSRNRGHQNALLAGLLSATEDAVITIDVDLQDDVNVIDEMVEHFINGSEVVYGVRKKRATDTFFKRLTAESFYKLMQVMGTPVVFNHADYRLMSREAIEHLKSFKETNLFIRGMIPLIGLKSSIIEYDRSKRMAGESKYPVKKMVAFAWEGITSFSVTPLRMISVIGFLVFIATLTISVWALGIRLFTDNAVPGWASTVLPIYLIGGLQILCMGVIGEYIGKIYTETKQRPRYIIEKKTQDNATTTHKK